LSAGELDAASRAALLRHADARIQERAAAVWGKQSLGARDEVIRKYQPALRLEGHAKAGQKTFERLCTPCHKLNGAGNEIGPNLALASTRSPDELLTSILDPSRQVDPAYALYNVEMIDGESVSGLVVADNTSGITLKGVGFTNTIPKMRISKLSSSGQSLMPAGLEEGLSEQDVADLLSFLLESQYELGTSGRSYSENEQPAREE
jgi:putative heme-binding domain-containing protein